MSKGELPVRPFEISEETRKKLSELAHAKPGFWESVSGKASVGATRLFDDIAAADELGAVPSLGNFISGQRAVSVAAKAAIRQIMFGRLPDELRRLDEICRQFSRYSTSYWAWAQIKPRQLSRIAGMDDVLFLGLLSFHPSGWVRSAATKRLGRLSGGYELDYLILRANDWVEPVRDLAWKAIRRRLHPDYAEAFARNMGNIVALEAKTRTSMDELLADIHGFLLSNPAVLNLATRHENFRIRRGAFRTAYRLDEEQLVKFIKRALRDTDSLTRLIAAKQAALLADVSLRNEFMHRMLSDRWHAVRSQALHMAVRDSGDATTEILLKLLLDQSRTVRSAARYYLRQLGVEDFRRIYIDVLPSDHKVAAILGLGECGVADDAKAIESYLESSNSGILGAAVTATSRLLPNDSDNMLLTNLAHRHKAPSNACLLYTSDAADEVSPV